MVAPDDAVPAPENCEYLHFPEAAVFPGLVNVHTHLELGALDERVEHPTFFEWIRFIRSFKERTEPDQFRSGAKRGLLECWRYGVTTVADTGDTGAATGALTELGGSGVVFQEVFGPHPDQAVEAMGELRDRFGALEAAAGPRVKIGVSPHAPYSVSAALYSQVAEFAGSSIPVAMHLAESEAESRLIQHGEGPFAEMWKARGIPPIARADSPVEFVARTGILDHGPLIIHAIRVNQNDATMLASTGSRIASCPISNRAHGHGDPPAHLWFESGMAVGLGTDSVASVGDLDLFREAVAFRSFYPGSAAEGLERMTVRGAEVLGLESEIGSLQSGHWGDLCVAGIGLDVDNPEEVVLKRGGAGILRTYLGGRCVYAGQPEGNEPT